MKYDELKQRLIPLLINKGVIEEKDARKAFEEMEDDVLKSALITVLEAVNQHIDEITANYDKKINNLEKELYGAGTIEDND